MLLLTRARRRRVIVVGLLVSRSQTPPLIFISGSGEGVWCHSIDKLVFGIRNSMLQSDCSICDRQITTYAFTPFVKEDSYCTPGLLLHCFILLVLEPSEVMVADLWFLHYME